MATHVLATPNPMTIREALEELGVERVRMAMASFGRLIERPGWEACFLARAYGKPWKLCQDAQRDHGLDLDGQESASDVALLMGISASAARAIVELFDEQPGSLRQEAAIWLAEHGSHPEPALFTAHCDEALAE